MMCRRRTDEGHFGRGSICGVAVVAAFGLWIGLGAVQAETQSVIDPTQVPAPPKPPEPKMKKPQESDSAVQRERQRAKKERRKREEAEARALAAEKEAKRLRAEEDRRKQEEAAARALAAEKEAEKQRAEEERRKQEEAAARALAAEKEAEKLRAAEKARQAAEAAATAAAAKEAAAKEAEAAKAGVHPGKIFRDCADCPEMVWLPRGEFMMGTEYAEKVRMGNEGRQRLVKIDYFLAVGRYEVTFAEWDACVAAGGCSHRPDDQGWGRGRRPVINVSWEDAQQFVAWLSRKTGQRYRLLTEAEWEYAARAGTQTRFWWGNDVGQNRANCKGCGSRWDGRQTAPVGSFDASPYGLYDMEGNVSEWVEDCWHENYDSAPTDGSAWTRGCTNIPRILRGNSWASFPGVTRAMLVNVGLRAALNRHGDRQGGFRIARSEALGREGKIKHEMIR